FYLLSRYEEYFDDNRDLQGNYNYGHSILYKLKMLNIPVVEQWMELLKDILKKNFPSLQFKKESPRCLLSFDIDVAFAYKNKSLARTIGGLTKKFLTLNFKVLSEQLRTLLNKKNDTYDTYDYIFSKITNRRTIFFFNMGRYSRYDKNPSWKNKKFRQV